MKSSRFFLAFLLMACLAAPVVVGAQDKAMTQEKMMGKEKAMTQKMTQEQMMAQMMKYANPVKEHEYLKKYVGSWDAEIKAWSQPGAEPMISKGTMKGELLYDGRYVKTEFESTMMNMPFKGIQILGYDLFQKKYTAIWLDNMSTHFSPTMGTLDPAGKVFTETGIWPDPMTGGKSKVKIVTTWLSDGKYRFEMFMTGADGKEIKSMEITYTRRT